MSKKIKPLEVSPLIKTARYIFLFSGIVYGIMKYGALKAYELTAAPKRRKMYHEKKEINHQRDLEHTRQELRALIEQMGIQDDVTPGWEQDV